MSAVRGPVVLLLALLALSLGCATAQAPRPRLAPFLVEEYERFAPDRLGTSEIRGQAFAVTQGGGVIYAAGRPVFLVPVTTYSREWFQATIVRGEALTPSAYPEEERYIKHVMADGEGRFRFADIPYGRYYLYTEIDYLRLSPSGYRQAVVIRPWTEEEVAPKEGVEVQLVSRNAPDNTGWVHDGWDGPRWNIGLGVGSGWYGRHGWGLGWSTGWGYPWAAPVVPWGWYGYGHRWRPHRFH